MLTTLAQAKAHLRITTPDGDPGDADLVMKQAQAEAIVLDYCNTTLYWQSITAAWTPETVPPFVQAAMLQQLGELWRFRGDDVGAAIYSPGREAGSDLSPVVIGLLRRVHDPVIA